MKARINSGHQRHPKSKVASPMKPAKVQLRSGFQPATSGLNTSGSRRPIPHDATTSPSATGSDLKLNLAGIGKRGGRKMY